MMKKRNPHQMPHDEQAADQAADQARTADRPGKDAEADASVQASGQSEAASQPETAGQDEAAGNGAGAEQATGTVTVAKAEFDKNREDYRVLTDRYLRLMAEYENFRKRSQKEREGLYQDSVAAVVKEWLPVIDNLDRAEQAAQAAEGESARRIADGVAMVLKQAEDAMARLNIQPIDCLGQTFDPQQADAVLHVEDDSVGPSTVVEILQKGYRCGDRVIRHCMVKVAN